jgi:glycosyltransferase involved in cell wall biosynthesis
VTDKKHIVYLGSSGFPYGLAEIQKILLISKSQVLAGNTVTVFCRRGMHNIADFPEMKAIGTFEGVNYNYTSGSPFRNERFFIRNFLKVKGVINKYLILRKLKKENKLDFAILSTHSFFSVFYYYILSKLLGFKTVLNYVEYYSGVKKKWYRVGKRLNDKLFDKYAPRLADAVFLISEFLILHLNKISPGKKYLKIPNLTDVERFKGIERTPGPKYFLFCGDAGYFEIIKFIIDSFEKLDDETSFLYLVINGHEVDKQVVRNYIENNRCKERIRYLSKLTDRELSNYYKNALALLIPLRPTFQDTARFPHKIGEYLASGSPVISTNYGEVKHYFKDMENMLIAEKYETELFTAKMQYALDHPNEIEQIANKGKCIAFSQFDFRVNGDRIANFLNELK